jgi:hypothetical protein
MEKRSVFEDFADFSDALSEGQVSDGSYNFFECRIVVFGDLVTFEPRNHDALQLLTALLDNVEEISGTVH